MSEALEKPAIKSNNMTVDGEQEHHHSDQFALEGLEQSACFALT